MRYYDDTKYYHFSTNPVTDEEERSEIFEDHKEYAKEFLSGAFKPEPTAIGNIKKFAGVGFFLICVGLLIFFSLTKNVPGILYTFGGVFIGFGIMFFIPSKEETIELPGQTKFNPFIVGCLAIAIGLSVIIPAILATQQGYSKATVGGVGALFLLCGLFFVFYNINGMMRFSRAFKETARAKVIGYIKMIESNDNAGGSAHHTHLMVTGTPVFEYHYHGRQYKAFQEDNMRTGRLSPDVGEVVDVGVLPEDPYAVFYHKNTGGRIFAFVLSLLAVAAGVVCFVFMPKMTDANGFVVDTMGGHVSLAKAQFDDALIESYVNTSEFTIEYVTVTSVYNVEGQWAMDLSNDTKRAIVEEDKDKYYEGCGIYLVIPGEGTQGLSFIADDWEYTGSHEVINAPEG